MHKHIGRAIGRQARRQAGRQAGRDRNTGRQTDIVCKLYLVMIPCVMPFLAAEMRKKRQL